MNKEQPDLSKKVEQSLDYFGKEKYVPNPYLYTRVKEQLRQEKTPARLGSLWKPALLAAVLLLNGIAIYQTVQSRKSEWPERLSNAYQLGEQSNAYNYLMSTTE